MTNKANLKLKYIAFQEPDNLIYNSVVAKEKSLNASGFEFEASLMILIHDFTGNGYTGWVKVIEI